MRAIFLDDAQKLYAKRLNLAFLILSLIVLASLFFAVAIWIGKDLGRREAISQMEVRHTEPLVAPALTQWSCLPQEMREYVHACKGRVRLGKVGS